MRPIATATAAIVINFAGMSVASGAPLPKETGLWFDDTGKGAVRIEPCGGDKLCGRIVWLKEPVNERGEVLTDKRNPDEQQRSRPICGLPILGQLAPMPEGGFDGGWVYDPKQGASFSVAIDLVNNDQLTVTGYKGVRFLGKKFTWTRVKTELPTCENKPAQPDTSKGKASNGASVGAVGAGTAGSAKVSAPARQAVRATGAQKVKKTAINETAASSEVLPWETKAAASKPAESAPAAKRGSSVKAAPHNSAEPVQ